MHGIHAITFDVGGTLIRPYPSVGEIYAEVMADHGLELPAAELEAGFGVTIREAFKSSRLSIGESSSEKAWWQAVVRDTIDHVLGGVPSGQSEDAFAAMFEAIWDAFISPHRWQLADQAREVLSELRQRGYRTAVLSNWDERLRPLLDGLELSRLFDAIIVSCEVGAEKPDIRIFRHAEAALDIAPAGLLHIGDSARHDGVGATNAGWQVRLLTKSNSTSGKYASIQHLSKLLTHLD